MAARSLESKNQEGNNMFYEDKLDKLKNKNLCFEVGVDELVGLSDIIFDLKALFLKNNSLEKEVEKLKKKIEHLKKYSSNKKFERIIKKLERERSIETEDYKKRLKVYSEAMVKYAIQKNTNQEGE